ncbi:efflux RND transporter periplasmic adaptor subunit [Roseiarcus sp.]|uniref:efflux RND transporter periplasmic adaptor subunit n=1 Tax=Roseiarcus sp. TaxID=1969460 RepID=UPI003F971D19
MEDAVPAGRMLAPSETEVEAPHRPDADEVGEEPERTPKRRRWRWIVLLLAIAVAGAGAWRLLSPKEARQQRPAQQVQPVGAAKIDAGDIDHTLSGLGTVTPLFTITVQTQINGQLMDVGFKEGQLVHKGDFLAQIDDRPYKAALALAQGSLAHDTGLLEQAQSDLARYELLGKQDSIAMQQVADQKFLVEQDKGLVQQDQANVETAKLNIAYCHIVAPVTGRVGLRLVDPGNFVQTTSTTGLVVLAQVEPISVVFVLPEDDIETIWSQVKQGQTLSVSVYDRTNDKLIATGTLASLDNLIDTTTGTLKLRAIFANTDEMLYPNQFVNARMVVQTLKNVTIAPVAAIQHGAPGDFVFLIKPDDSIAVQKVQTGVTEGDRIQIVSGLKAGDTVVVDGADRLREGMKVRISDQNDGAANTNNGPGAPPGEQPDNARKVPPDSRVRPEKNGGSAPSPSGATNP